MVPEIQSGRNPPEKPVIEQRYQIIPFLLERMKWTSASEHLSATIFALIRPADWIHSFALFMCDN
jgi:hypothetical protein